MWAGVDSAWEQKKLEARKMLENAPESPASSARFVGWRLVDNYFLGSSFSRLCQLAGRTIS